MDTVPSRIETVTADESGKGVRLDVFLAGALGLSRSKVHQLIDDGHVTSSTEKQVKQSLIVSPGDRFEIAIVQPREPEFLPEAIPLDILYQDEHLIVVNKPPGMVVHPGRGNMTGTLAGALLAHAAGIVRTGDPLRPGIVHRLDKDTSGVMVAALTERSHRLLSAMVRDHAIIRRYTAFVWGHPVPPSGTIDEPIGRHPKYGTLKTVRPDGRSAVTHYETEAVYAFVTKLAVQLETGRTHQIRVHFAHRNHHIFGDPVYGGREERLGGFQPEIRTIARRLLAGLDRQALHACELRFDHPIDGRPLSFAAPLPEDMVRFENALRSGAFPGFPLDNGSSAANY